MPATQAPATHGAWCSKGKKAWVSGLSYAHDELLDLFRLCFGSVSVCICLGFGSALCARSVFGIANRVGHFLCGRAGDLQGLAQRMAILFLNLTSFSLASAFVHISNFVRRSSSRSDPFPARYSISYTCPVRYSNLRAALLPLRSISRSLFKVLVTCLSSFAFQNFVRAVWGGVGMGRTPVSTFSVLRRLCKALRKLHTALCRLCKALYVLYSALHRQSRAL